MPPVRFALNAAPERREEFTMSDAKRGLGPGAPGANGKLTLTRTDGEPVAEVVHAIAHDDHPGDAGDSGVLHLLIRVAVAAVGVAVAVAAAALRGGLVAARRFRRRLVGGGVVGRPQLRELSIIVLAVAGDGAAVEI